jgi:tryptophan 2,3-dioxygenase
MIGQQIQAAHEELVGRGTGLGAACGATADATSRQRVGSDAHAALDAWENRSCSLFPYTEVITHFRAVGRTQADPALVLRLSSVPADRQDAFLAAWLPMTCDQETGGYVTYAGLRPHLLAAGADRGEDVDAAPPYGGGRDRLRSRLDELTVAVLGDLLRTEAAAAGLGAPVPAVRTRLRATARLLVLSGELAPDYPLDPSVTADVAAALARTQDSVEPLAEASERAAKTVLELVSPLPAQSVARSLLPVTRLHDEIMFIRSIQVFEALYEQIGLAATESRDALLEGRLDEAVDALAAVTDRMTVLPALFRLLGTMPVESFAVIRGYTSGRSAVQSRSYRRIEAACAPHPPSGAIDALWTGPTLQEVWTDVRTRPGADRLTEQLRRLDTSWRGMKRSHWGITLRIIGEVPGTGGTAGASYLKTTSEAPLFPALTGKGER